MAKESFVTFPEESFESDFDSPDYIRFKERKPVTVRILDESATHVRKHWINAINTSVLCLGDRCPLCENNEHIRQENPNNFRNVNGYVPYQNRYMVNVLDRTPVIVDPETGDEYVAVDGEFPTMTSDGSRSLAGLEPQPSNTIKILERGKQLFEQLQSLHQERLSTDDAGEFVGGITTFDVKFKTFGSGPKMTITTVPLFDQNDDVTSIIEDNELARYPLSTVGIELTPEEMVKAVRGTSLRDIFTARNADTDIEELDGHLADAAESVANLFDS